MAAVGSKAERTRKRVLEAAERQFADHGFQAARLEDVASEVGVKRAALFYHFRDKRALHDAVLREVFGSLLAHLQEIMARELPFAERAALSAAAWVDLQEATPARARLILRQVAAGGGDWRRLLPIAAPFLEWMRHELRDAASRDEIDPVDDDPLALLGAVAGAISLAGEAPTAARREHAVRLTHRLLGVR